MEKCAAPVASAPPLASPTCNTTHRNISLQEVADVVLTLFCVPGPGAPVTGTRHRLHQLIGQSNNRAAGLQQSPQPALLSRINRVAPAALAEAQG